MPARIMHATSRICEAIPNPIPKVALASLINHYSNLQERNLTKPHPRIPHLVEIETQHRPVQPTGSFSCLQNTSSGGMGGTCLA